ncbi:hypothetical protein [Blastopirellula marina]|uniref:Uncharacterized protein n=1 Tax=Blastopirellula marina TaxID=124 RepID=A0A2S8F399_9BACT|nr:hypothetical protein [Blastopirellula marina]PQO26646.1 hypothetical protein C5Y98_30160 [Blastopirellula marina]PTL40957.1 hypothetical protein C5Y97_30175 [Blastopirellula marina]
MRSLIGKEWRENQFVLLLCGGWMLLGTVYCIGYEVTYQFRAAIGSFSGIAMLYAVCAALYLATRTSQGEQADGTLGFTASLPVSLRKVAAARIIVAAATLALPILIAAALLKLAFVSGLIEQAAPRPFPYQVRLPDRETASLLTSLEQLWSVAVIASLGGTQLLLWLCLFGCWLRSQTQVGFLGAVLGLASMIFQGIFWSSAARPAMWQLVYGAFLPQSLAIQWGYGAEQGGYTDHELAQYRWISLAFAIVVQLLIGLFFTTQYGRLRGPAAEKKGSRWRWRLPAMWSYIPVRPWSPMSALVWVEMRQAFPLVLYGFVLALLVTAVTLVMEGHETYSLEESFRSQLPHTVFFVGMLWSTVVAAGLFSADLGDRLGSFWRSRPISPAAWFWTKYLVGLLMVLIVLDGVSIVVAWNSPRNGPTEGMSWAFVACFPILHAWIYTLAVLGTCWLRKPVLGGFLAIVAYALFMTVVTSFPATNWLEPVTVYNALLMAERQGSVSFWGHGYPIAYGGLVLSLLLFAFVAARAARPLEPEGTLLALGR